MRYWWVNQNQTFRHEFDGGYLWSPKRNANGGRNPFHEAMREAAPGDLVFSFADTRIRAFGIVTSNAYENPKPGEFGSVGRNWERVGWRVDVAWQLVPTVVRPAEWMELLGPLLPSKYAPLQADGRGLQGVYMTELPQPFALQLAHLVGSEVEAIARTESVADLPLANAESQHPELVLWEEHLRRKVEEDPSIAATEREAIVLARRGQGLFKQRVQALEQRCRITGVDRPEHLRASHSKPWREAPIPMDATAITLSGSTARTGCCSRRRSIICSIGGSSRFGTTGGCWCRRWPIRRRSRRWACRSIARSRSAASPPGRRSTSSFIGIRFGWRRGWGRAGATGTARDGTALSRWRSWSVPLARRGDT